MTRHQIIEQTGQLLAELPEAQAAEVLDFAGSLHQRQRQLAVADEALLNRQLKHHLDTSEAFAFLHDAEEDVYTLADVKFRYETPSDATE